jgi:hypothetical protein
MADTWGTKPEELAGGTICNFFPSLNLFNQVSSTSRATSNRGTHYTTHYTQYSIVNYILNADLFSMLRILKDGLMIFVTSHVTREVESKRFTLPAKQLDCRIQKLQLRKFSTHLSRSSIKFMYTTLQIQFLPQRKHNASSLER